MNTRTLLVYATTPPLMISLTYPVKTSPDSLASTILSQPAIASKRRLESIAVPSWSLIFIMIRFNLSSTLTSSVSLTSGSEEYSAAEMYPVTPLPISTVISVGLTATTMPSTFWSPVKPLSEASNASSSVISSKVF